MKRKVKVITIIIGIIIAMLFGIGDVQGATGNLTLRLEMLRKSGYGYKAFEKNIWKIVSEDDNYTYDSTIYCIKA